VRRALRIDDAWQRIGATDDERNRTMYDQTALGLHADAHQADLHEQARSARLAREAGLHTGHHQNVTIGAGHRRLVATFVSLVLALAMGAGVALANDTGGSVSGVTGCAGTGRLVAC
jgi:hypothetical protein